MITEIPGNMKGRRWSGVWFRYSGLVIRVHFGCNCASVECKSQEVEGKSSVIELLYVINLVVYMEKCRFSYEERLLLQIV